MKQFRNFFVAALGAMSLFVGALPGMAGDQPAEPQAYRMEDYRAPTPATLAGARVVDTDGAFALWKDKRAVFVDVLPHAPKPPNLPSSTVWREKRRDNIPGSLWLPDVGYGAISPDTANYFRKGLERAAARDKGREIVFYCLADCWMSWNAAKRALSMGYSNVVWYPEGTDGWSAEGHALEQSLPEPRE